MSKWTVYYNSISFKFKKQKTGQKGNGSTKDVGSWLHWNI